MCFTIGSSALHYNALHCCASELILLHCEVHYISLHCSVLHSTALHCTSLHPAKLHIIALDCTEILLIALHCCSSMTLNCTVKHCTALRQKSNCAGHIVIPDLCRSALLRHSCQNSIRKLSVSYSDTFVRLINVPDTLGRVWHLRLTQLTISLFLMSSLMSRVTTSTHWIVTVMVNSDAY